MIRVTPVDHATVRVDTDPSILRELSDRLTFEAPGAQFDARVRKGQWDGLIRLLHLGNKTCHAGLVDRIQEFAAENDHPFQYVGRPRVDQDITEDEALAFIDEIGIPKEFDRRPYQVAAFRSAVKNRRRLFISPTSSGKSLIIYLLTRWYGLKTLIIVPTVGLVHQMAGDFAEYGCNPDIIHKIQDGRDGITRDIVVSTWQSIYEMPPEWFDQFGLVIGDEAHLFKAKSLTQIMTNLTRCAYRFGFTGTLDGSEVHQLVLEGLFGPTEVVITTRELMDMGYVAKLMIEVVILKHPKKGVELLKALTKAAQAKSRRNKGAVAYATEMDYLASCEARNKFLTRMALKLKGNNLILFHRVDHGDRLFDMMHESGTSCPIHLINGGVDGLERDEIRGLVDAADNAQLLASSGTSSTGISIRRINNLIMGTPWKGRIMNLQSIGRSLRLAKDKNECTVYDIADDLSGRGQNHTLKHLMARIEIYNQEGFDYRIHHVDLNY